MSRRTPIAFEPRDRRLLYFPRCQRTKGALDAATRIVPYTVQMSISICTALYYVDKFIFLLTRSPLSEAHRVERTRQRRQSRIIASSLGESYKLPTVN
jgi:hypothetical protein